MSILGVPYVRKYLLSSNFNTTPNPFTPMGLSSGSLLIHRTYTISCPTVVTVLSKARKEAGQTHTLVSCHRSTDHIGGLKTQFFFIQSQQTELRHWVWKPSWTLPCEKMTPGVERGSNICDIWLNEDGLKFLQTQTLFAHTCCTSNHFFVLFLHLSFPT